MKLMTRLLEVSGVKYVDLWNRNVEFIDQEASWARPAVFVEFGPIKWEVMERGKEYRGKSEMKLHIVTDWSGDSSSESADASASISALDLSEEIQKAVWNAAEDSQSVCRFDLSESDTNHDHEEIVENIEVYSVTWVRKI